MKRRIAAFVFAACLMSSLAFADNPSDAPLVTNYQIDPVVQADNPTNHKQQKNKKKGSEPPNTNCANAPKSDHQMEQRNPQYPATNGSTGN